MQQLGVIHRGSVGRSPMPFVLASGSPRRRELLASLGIEFVVIKSDIDETQARAKTLTPTSAA